MTRSKKAEQKLIAECYPTAWFIYQEAKRKNVILTNSLLFRRDENGIIFAGGTGLLLLSLLTFEDIDFDLWRNREQDDVFFANLLESRGFHPDWLIGFTKGYLRMISIEDSFQSRLKYEGFLVGFDLSILKAHHDQENQAVS